MEENIPKDNREIIVDVLKSKLENCWWVWWSWYLFKREDLEFQNCKQIKLGATFAGRFEFTNEDVRGYLGSRLHHPRIEWCCWSCASKISELCADREAWARWCTTWLFHCLVFSDVVQAQRSSIESQHECAEKAIHTCKGDGLYGCKSSWDCQSHPRKAIFMEYERRFGTVQDHRVERDERHDVGAEVLQQINPRRPAHLLHQHRCWARSCHASSKSWEVFRVHLDSRLIT